MNNDHNNDNYDINNQLLINNYITYSREYMITTQNVMNNLARNDDRIHNLIYLNWLNRSNTSNSNQINNQQSQAFGFSFNNNSQTPFSNSRNDMRNRRPTVSNTRNVRPRQMSNRTRSQPQTTIFNRAVGSDSRIPTSNNGNYINHLNNPLNSISRDLTDIFENAINNVDWITNLEPVPVTPTEEQISMACEDISYNQIANPINNSCPINLERLQIILQLLKLYIVVIVIHHLL